MHENTRILRYDNPSLRKLYFPGACVRQEWLILRLRWWKTDLFFSECSDRMVFHRVALNLKCMDASMWSLWTIAAQNSSLFMVAASWSRRTVVTKNEHDASGQLRGYRYRCLCCLTITTHAYSRTHGQLTAPRTKTTTCYFGTIT